MYRIIDICVAALAILVTLPIVLIAGLAVMLHDGLPVLYYQERVGKNMKSFRLIKIRSMTVSADSGSMITRNCDPRMTSVGRLIRKYKIDELPQFYNVLKGDMSLVGPRPEVRKYVNHYVEMYTELMHMPPGITSWASIVYRDEGALLSSRLDPESYYLNQVLPNKIRIDLEMMKNMSVYVYISVIANTVLSIVVPQEENQDINNRVT